jgi:hypothetical protein
MKKIKLFFFAMIIITIVINAQQKNIQSYFNKTYNYQISFPTLIKLDSAFEDELYLDNQKVHLVIRILDLEQLFEEYKAFNNLPQSDDKFLDVTMYHAVSTSGADGPDGSVYVENPSVADDYKSPSGLHVIKFYSDLLREDFNSKTTKCGRSGPFYGIKLNEKFSLFIVYNYGLELASSENEQMLRSIANSVVIKK